MRLVQVQQLSRHPTDYGAEILVQVIFSVISMTIISMMISPITQDEHVFATSRGSGILVVYKIELSDKLSR